MTYPRKWQKKTQLDACLIIQVTKQLIVTISIHPKRRRHVKTTLALADGRTDNDSGEGAYHIPYGVFQNDKYLK